MDVLVSLCEKDSLANKFLLNMTIWGAAGGMQGLIIVPALLLKIGSRES